MEQLAAVLITGNIPVVEDIFSASPLLMDLPPEVSARIRWISKEEDGFGAAILYAGDRETLATLRQRIARQTLSIVPIIEADARSGHYPLYRLIGERVLSVNTAAAGGNAALMSLPD